MGRKTEQEGTHSLYLLLLIQEDQGFGSLAPVINLVVCAGSQRECH